ncbi:MAG: DUF4830 domain-containing protein [Clostridia bacterium]|nr:DUF4830 domain-containing protein [Clostridia bacterium]
MFVWSFRTSKRELIIILIGIVAFVITVCLLLFAPSGSKQSSLLVEGGYSLSAEDADGRMSFLSQFGWEADPEPVAVKEVLIPLKFNGVYTEYNELQKSQGFDLEPLSGKRLKLWTYRITNYPNVSDNVVANILTLDGNVVGGDISSTALDGFMHGFDPNQYSAETASAQLDVQTIDRSVPDSIPEQSDTPPENDGE